MQTLCSNNPSIQDSTYTQLASQYKQREKVIELELYRKKQEKEDHILLDHENPFWLFIFAIGMIAFVAMLFWVGDWS